MLRGGRRCLRDRDRGSHGGLQCSPESGERRVCRLHGRLWMVPAVNRLSGVQRATIAIYETSISLPTDCPMVGRLDVRGCRPLGTVVRRHDHLGELSDARWKVDVVGLPARDLPRATHHVYDRDRHRRAATPACDPGGSGSMCGCPLLYEESRPTIRPLGVRRTRPVRASIRRGCLDHKVADVRGKAGRAHLVHALDTYTLDPVIGRDLPRNPRTAAGDQGRSRTLRIVRVFGPGLGSRTQGVRRLPGVWRPSEELLRVSFLQQVNERGLPCGRPLLYGLCGPHAERGGTQGGL